MQGDTKGRIPKSKTYKRKKRNESIASVCVVSHEDERHEELKLL